MLSFTPPPSPPPEVRHLSAPQYGRQPLLVHSHGYLYRVVGNTHLPPQLLWTCIQQAATPEEAVQKLDVLYHKRGYFLTAQKASVQGHTVTVEIIQGSIVREEVPSGLRWFFLGLRNRSDIRYDDIIYHSVLANAYTQRNGQQLQIGFAPAPEPYGSTLQVTQKPLAHYSPFTGDAFFGNYGSRYASRFLTGGSLSYSPGYGLNLSVNASQGLPTLAKASKGSAYTTGGVSLSSITPWGVYGFNANWTHYRIGQIAFPVEPDGNIFTWALTGMQLLSATESSRWTLSEGYTHTNNQVQVYQSVIPGGYPLTRQNYNYFSLGTAWNGSFSVLGESASVSAGITYNQGTSANSGTLYRNEPGAPTARFHYFDANVSYIQPLPYGMLATFNAQGQGAFNTLPSNQQWVLGGLGNLSAYYPGILEGDSGYSARFQLSSPPWKEQGFTLTGALFAELGGATNTYLAPRTAPWQSLSDVGASLSAATPWGTSLTLLSALPTGYNHVSAAIRKQDRVDFYFVLSQSF